MNIAILHNVSSSNNCNFLLERLVRCSIVEFSDRSVIDQPLHPSHRVRSDLSDVGPFRDQTSDDPDLVFHRSLVMASVRAGETGLYSEQPRHLVMTAESLVGVEGY